MNFILRIAIIVSVIFLPNVVFAALQYNYEINGIDGDALTNAEARLDIEIESYGDDLTQRHLLQLYNNSSQVIQQAIEPYGYFKSTVNSKYQKNQDGLDGVFNVKPGPVMHINDLDIKVIGPGANDELIQTYLKNLPLRKGDALNVESFNKIKKRLYSLAIEQGYLTPTLIEHQLIINLKTYSAQAVVRLDSGPLFYFGDVRFNDTPLSDDFLRRYINFVPGEVFSNRKLQLFQQHLQNSGYFIQATVNPKQNAAVDNRVPIEVTLTPSKSQQYRFGVGYGTDTGARATIGVDWRRLTDTGHNFKTLLTVSQISTSLDAQYNIPGRNPVNQNYFINAGIAQETPQNDSRGTYERIGVGYTTPVFGWQQNASLIAQHENYIINGNEPYQDAYLLYPTVTWTHNTFDNPIFPLYGNSISINVRGAAEQLLSTTTFLQGQIQDRAIFSLTDNNRFVLRGTFGYTLINQLDELPLSLQFFTGGSQSVRGYGYQELGPGTTLIVGSAEYQRRVYDEWYATAFYDIGNATNHIFCRNSLNPSCQLKRSPGFGVMWASPIGSLEASLAKALDSDGQPWRFSFNIGVSL